MQTTDPRRLAAVTLFPELFDALIDSGITSRAFDKGLVTLECINPRDFTSDRHRTVDDRPYGGGPGMLMSYQPLADAIAEARQRVGHDAPVIALTPQGQRMDQGAVKRFASLDALILVCGRYEGIDERLLELEVDEQCSIGDYVLSGGELAALVMLDAVIRQYPGALGHQQSAAQDSFYNGLLDCPHYTRPERIGEHAVPGVLLSGNHQAIRRWRLQQALGRTWQRRPDLLKGRPLSQEEHQLLQEFIDAQQQGGE